MVKIRVKKTPPKKEYVIIAGVAMSILIGGYLGILIKRFLNFFKFDNRAQFSFDPFTAIKTAFTSVEGLIGMAVAGMAILALSLYYSKKGIFDFDPNDDRNFRVSDQGTYGTANFATQDTLAKVFDVLPCEKTTGTILGMCDEKGLETVSRPDHNPNKNTGIRLNPNIAVFGSAGSGKSYSLIRPAIIQSSKNGESMIITDPKGEMYRDTSAYLRKLGYKVKVFNLLDIATSDAWNCFNDILSEEDKVTMAQTLSDIIIRNTSGPDGGERFWDEAEKNLLTALVLLVVYDSNHEYGENRGLGTVYGEITSKDSLSTLKSKIADLPTWHPVHAPFQLFAKSSEKVQSDVVLGLGARLQVFQNENVRKVTSFNEIDLTLPGKERCAYYLIMSDQDRTFNFLSSMFFSFLFIRLVNYAYAQPSGSLPVRVNMLLDEFCNCGVIPDFDRKISTVRSRNISMMLIMQNLPQLKNRYPGNTWEEILGNCDIQICLGCNDETTAKYVSNASGIMTIDVSTIRTTRHTVPVMEMHPEYQRSSGVGKRAVLNPDEVRRMEKTKLILMSSGMDVVVLNKFNYKLLKESKQFMLADPKLHKPYWRVCEMELEAKRPNPVQTAKAEAAEAAASGTTLTQTRPSNSGAQQQQQQQQQPRPVRKQQPQQRPPRPGPNRPPIPNQAQTTAAGPGENSAAKPDAPQQRKAEHKVEQPPERKAAAPNKAPEQVRKREPEPRTSEPNRNQAPIPTTTCQEQQPVIRQTADSRIDDSIDALLNDTVDVSEAMPELFENGGGNPGQSLNYQTGGWYHAGNMFEEESKNR